jgi:RecA-family ATPase
MNMDEYKNDDAENEGGPIKGKSWRDGIITAAELQTKQFKPVRTVLPGLIVEGSTLLAGKPKVGKSWLALDVCLAVADETRFVLGEMKPIHGDVLYLALEDNERRLHRRIAKIVQGERGWPGRLTIRTEWRRVDQGGLEDIEEWMKSVKEPRLVWVDTLPKIRPIKFNREQAYLADYRAMEGLQQLAGRHQVAIVVNAHLRKATSEDDPFDEISGTLGLSGAIDAAVVMKRHSGMMKVYIRGRDIEEAEFAAEFNRNTCRWRACGRSRRGVPQSGAANDYCRP